MRKYKVFLPTGTIQTILADSWIIDGVWLKFYVNTNNRLVAIFPENGWHGMHDVSVYEDTRKAMV